jgi:hypothetical protein
MADDTCADLADCSAVVLAARTLTVLNDLVDIAEDLTA